MVDTGNLGQQAGNIGSMLLNGFLILLGLGSIAGAAIWANKKKNWNLKVIVKIPRKGMIYDIENAKGRIDSKEGIVWIKRKGLKKAPTVPFDIKDYLIGKNKLEVIQTAPDVYMPVSQSSYEEFKDSLTGKNSVLLTIQADTSKHKAWKAYAERLGKESFMVQVRKKLETYLGFGILIICMFVGFAILWAKVGG
ncbi:MAG: hypothetical protein ACOCT9_00170 [archaeon]